MILTPSIAQSLRDSLKRPQPSDGTFSLGLGAFIIYRPRDAQGLPQRLPWLLHAYGHPIAAAGAPEPLLACLEREATEPGFIARLCDSRIDIETALLDSELFAQRMMRAAIESQQAAADIDAAADAAWRTRRVQLLDPTRVSLDDLE